MNPIIIALAAVAAIAALRQGSAAKKLSYYFKDLKTSGKGITDFKLILTLEVVNPTFTPLSINNLFATIYDASNNMLGRISMTDKLTIQPNGSTNLNLPIKLNAGAAVYFFGRYIQGKEKSVTVTGTINSQGVELPFNQKLNVSA